MEHGSTLHDRYRVVDTLVDAAPTTIYRGETTGDGHAVVIQTLDLFADDTDEVFRQFADDLLNYLKRGKRAVDHSPEAPLETPLCCDQTEERRIYLVYAIDPASTADLPGRLGRCLYQLLEAAAPLPDELEQMLAPVLTQLGPAAGAPSDESTREVSLDSLGLADGGGPTRETTTAEGEVETLDAGDQVPSVEVGGEADTGPRAETINQNDQLSSIDPDAIEPASPDEEGEDRAATVDRTDSIRSIAGPDDSSTETNESRRAATLDVGDRIQSVDDAAESDDPEQAAVTADELPNVSTAGDDPPRKETAPMESLELDGEDLEPTDETEKPTIPGDGSVDADAVAARARKPNTETDETAPEQTEDDNANPDADEAPDVALGPKFSDTSESPDDETAVDPSPTPEAPEAENGGRPVALIVGAIVAVLAVAALLVAWFVVG